MRRDKKYKFISLILFIVVIFETVLLVRFFPRKRLAPLVKVKGKIAIVLDDWGYNTNNLHFLDEISSPLSIAVLPNLPFSKEVAEQVRASGKELILHLPLEPQANEYVRLEKETIMVGMAPGEIAEIIAKDLKKFPNVKGLSNHMGSKVTRDDKTMRIIFRELKQHRLYFLDSLVSPYSLGAKVAAETGVKFLKRDIFLDNEQRADYILGQIDKLKNKALGQGIAVGIGHDRRITLQVLKEVIPQLRREGFVLVFVSELAKLRSRPQ